MAWSLFVQVFVFGCNGGLSEEKYHPEVLSLG